MQDGFTGVQGEQEKLLRNDAFQLQSKEIVDTTQRIKSKNLIHALLLETWIYFPQIIIIKKRKIYQEYRKDLKKRPVFLRARI